MTVFTIQSDLNRIIADAELKQYMKDLKSVYGRAPEKDMTLEQMKARYDLLRKELKELTKSYIKVTGERPKRMKATHAVAYTKEIPKKTVNDLSIHTNVQDRLLSKAPLDTIEGITNLLNFNAEYVIRKQEENEIRNRTAEEWRKLEREYVVSSNYTLMDFYDDYKSLIETKGSVLTWADYTEERKKWRQCRHRFCLEIFPIKKDNFKGMKPRKADSLYCCGEHNEKEKYARECYAETSKIYRAGTFLPANVYQTKLERYSDELYMENEVAIEPNNLQEIRIKREKQGE